MKERRLKSATAATPAVQANFNACARILATPPLSSLQHLTDGVCKQNCDGNAVSISFQHLHHGLSLMRDDVMCLAILSAPFVWISGLFLLDRSVRRSGMEGVRETTSPPKRSRKRGPVSRRAQHCCPPCGPLLPLRQLP